MSTTRSHRHLDAPRARVYRALLDPLELARWRLPDGMTSEVHAFDAREGGAFRISLHYAGAPGTGKTTARTDTYRGRFVKLVPDEQVVESIEFETADPAMRGEMTITWTLKDAGGGTDLMALHENVPPGVSPADNELGWQMSLSKLAALVEGRRRVLLPAPAPERICHFRDDALDTAAPLVWTVDSLLTPAECAALIDRVERIGFAPAPISSAGGFEMRPEIRNNTRVILDDPALAASLFPKIRPHVPDRMYRDTISVKGLNERFRFYRYHPGERFNAHFDGSFRRDVREESVLTFMIYLDDGFEGGSTKFLDHDVEVQPRTGLALLFQHSLLHEGSAVRSGVKHVLRTDVMYRQV